MCEKTHVSYNAGMQEHFDKNVYRYLLALTTLAVLGGTVFYHFVEKLTWVNSLYFCVVTLATVGYGDITPKTDAGKLFTTAYILIGVSIIGTFLSYNLRRNATRRLEKREQRKTKS